MQLKTLLSKEMLTKTSIVILFLLLLDNWVYMFGVLAIYMNAEKISLVSTLFCYILALNVLYCVTDSVCTETLFSCALLLQGIVSIAVALPVKNNDMKFCNRYGRFIVVIMNLLNLSMHPDFELLVAESDNPIKQSIMKAFSYSLVSNPFINISEIQYSVLVTSILYITILILFKWLKEKDTWKEITVNNEIAIVLFFDGILRAVIGLFFVLSSFNVIGPFKG